MQKWRLLVLAALAGGPILALAGTGAYFLWQTPWGFWVGWLLAASFAVASLVGWHWQRQRRLLRLDFTPELHWTERDRQAWRLVEERARKAAELTPEQLTSLNYFQETAHEMALELARFYHPSA